MRVSRRGAATYRVYRSTSIGGLDKLVAEGMDIAAAETYAEQESREDSKLFLIVTDGMERVSTFRDGRRVRSVR